MSHSADANATSSMSNELAYTSETDVHARSVQRLLDGETDWDRRLIAWGATFNPILVKETRQAMKSRQFYWTFILLITSILIWTCLGILFMVPTIYFASNGHTLLEGYLVLLSLPLLIVIPQASFRSMANELDDGTFEILSLALLRPSQIVAGKLWVALLQMSSYLAALTPCIVLTYLLRGVSLLEIILSLSLIAFVGMCLCILGLLLGAFSNQRYAQVINSLILVGLQIAGCTIVFFVLGSLQSWRSSEVASGTAVTLILCGFSGLYAWMLFRCTTALIGVTSDNRSTPIRIPMLVIGFFIFAAGDISALLFLEDFRYLMQGFAITSNFALAHWMLMGAFIAGEKGELPARARRTLPATPIRRLLLTWFNPGAGPGFLFVVLSFLGPSLVLAATAPILAPAELRAVWWLGFLYALTATAYLAMFVGTTRLLMFTFFRKLRSMRMIGSTVLMIALIVLSVLCTNLLSMWDGEMSFSVHCGMNPFWMLYEIIESMDVRSTGSKSTDPADVFAGSMLACSVGLIVFVVNAFLTARDVALIHYDRVPPPIPTDASDESEQVTVDPLGADA